MEQRIPDISCGYRQSEEVGERLKSVLDNDEFQ